MGISLWRKSRGVVFWEMRRIEMIIVVACLFSVAVLFTTHTFLPEHRNNPTTTPFRTLSFPRPPAMPPAPLSLGTAPAPANPHNNKNGMDPPGGTPVLWSEVAKRNTMLAAMVKLKQSTIY
jgi:hypothetical protein